MDKESAPVQILVHAAPDVTTGSPKTPLEISVLSTSSPSAWATPGSTLETEVADAGRKFTIAITPSADLSAVSVGSQSVWATPDAPESTEKTYSFREILSMPTLDDSSPQKNQSEPPLKTPTGIMNGIEVMNRVEAMNGSIHEVYSTPQPTPDHNESLSSPASQLTAPPNTPMVLFEDSLVFSPGDADVTVYEKTPFGVMPASERVSGVQIFEKSAQTVIGEAEKGSSRTYIVPEAPRVEGPAKLVQVDKLSADPSSDSVTAAVMNDTAVDAVDEIDGPAEPVAGAVNGKSQTVVTVLGDDSARLVAEGPDCDDLLGGCLVRPCPSMRPYRRLCAKGFLIGLLIVVVAFIVVMILVNRSSQLK